MSPKRIEINCNGRGRYGKNWVDQIIDHLKDEKENSDPFSGFRWEDNRFDYSYGSINGVHGSVDLEYDSVSVRPVAVVLPTQWPITDPYDDGNEIETPHELMEYIENVIIDEFPKLRGGEEEYPDLRLTCGFQILQDFGRNFGNRPHETLILNPEWEVA